MISLELARALQEAGLQWEPKNGDSYWYNNEPLVCCHGCTGFSPEKIGHCVYSPSLEQILTEIEARNYFPSLGKVVGVGYTVGFFVLLGVDRTRPASFSIESWKDAMRTNFISPKSWEDAAAEALVWILTREGDTK